MLKLGVITDEVSQSLEEAAAFAARYGLGALELRSVEGRGPFEWTMGDAARFQEIASRYGLRIVCVSSPLFKCDISDEEAIRAHTEGLLRCAEFCRLWGCRLIRGFDFWDTGAPVSARAAKFAPILKICEDFGLTCALEYDPSVHSSTPPRLLETVNAIASPRVRALFDPGNGLFSRPDSRPFPEDYETLRPVLCHIHLKDAVVENGKARAVRVGAGRVDYPGLLRRLAGDGYAGYLMLETHYRLDGELTEDQLKRPGGDGFSRGAYAASRESVESLLKIIQEEGITCGC